MERGEERRTQSMVGALTRPSRQSEHPSASATPRHHPKVAWMGQAWYLPES